MSQAYRWFIPAQRYVMLLLALGCCCLGQNGPAQVDNPAPLQPGELDLSFYPGAGADGEVTAIALQSDGKILLAGSFRTVGGMPRGGIARLHPDGRLDESFNPGTGFAFPDHLRPPTLETEPFATMTLLTESPDGRIWVGGFFTNYNGVSRPGSARLNPDGSLDLSYNPPAFAQGAILLQHDGKVITRLPGARLFSDGTRDTSFNAAHELMGIPHELDGLTSAIVMNNGDLLVAGQARDIEPHWLNIYSFLLRLRPDGSKEASFHANVAYQRVLELPDGRILTGVTLLSPYAHKLGGLAALHSDGRTDTNFNQLQGVEAFAAQSDGKILVATRWSYWPSNSPPSVFRLLPDGTLDSGFRLITNTQPVEALAIQADGNILIGGLFTNIQGVARSRIARLIGGEPLGPPQILGLPENRTVMEGQTISLVVRAAGNPPPVYQWLFNSQPIEGATNAVLALFDLRAGDAGSYSVLVSNRLGTAATKPARLMVIPAEPPVIIAPPKSQTVPEGATVQIAVSATNALPLSYQWLLNGTNLLSATNAALTLNNVRVAQGGMYSVIVQNEVRSITTAPALLTVTPARVVDPTFDPGSGPELPPSDYPGFTITLSAVAFHMHGKLLVTGEFLGFAGVRRNRIVRLNMDGSVDLTFDPGVGVTGGPWVPGPYSRPLTAIKTVVVQPNGKILIGGAFEKVSNLRYSCLARLNRDGGVDPTFPVVDIQGGPVSTMVAGPNAAVWAMTVQSDGKLILGGAFTKVNGVVRKNVCRLNADWTVDTSFDAGDTVPPASLPDMGVGVDQIAVEAGGAIWVHGRLDERVNKRDAIRLKPSGMLDELSDSSPVKQYSCEVRAIAANLDGKILAAISPWPSGPGSHRLVGLEPDGTLDPLFENQTEANGPIRVIAQQPDGRIIIAGGFTEVAGARRIGLARLGGHGALDLSFDPGLGPDAGNGNVDVVAARSDGAILVGGRFATFDGAARAKVALLDGDDPAQVRVRTVASGFDQVLLSFRTVPALLYQLESTESLGGTDWRPVQALSGDGSRQQFLQPRSGATRFFRVRVSEP